MYIIYTQEKNKTLQNFANEVVFNCFQKVLDAFVVLFIDTTESSRNSVSWKDTKSLIYF